MADTDPELERLIEGYLSGALDESETEALNRRLAASPETRREFHARMQVHAALVERYSDEEDRAAFGPIHLEPLPNPRLGRATLWSAGLAAAAAVVILVALNVPQDKPSAEDRGLELAALAQVVRADEAEWLSKSGLPGELGPGEHELRAGLVEFQIGAAVRVAVEGPARFTLLDSARMRLHEGRLAAEVEAGGEGFTIETPDGEVIDLGTRFAVRVEEDGSTEAHVFEGEIDVVSETETRRLSDGGAVKVRTLEPVASDPLDFPMPSHRLRPAFASGDFEPGQKLADALPVVPGVWGGDRCEVVQGFEDEAVRPLQGDGMLRFLASHGSASPNGGKGQKAAELWQVIDLRPFASTVNDGQVRARLSGYFNRGVASPNALFQLHLGAYRGPLDASDELWKRRHDPTSPHLATASASVVSDDDPDTWEPLEVSLVVPTGTDFLLINLNAFEDQTDRDEEEFEAHFADSVHLELTAEARASVPQKTWRGEPGRWQDAAAWSSGVPDPARDRVVIQGEGEMLVERPQVAKQSLILARDVDSIARMRIRRSGTLYTSGNGSLQIGYNEGGKAELVVEGKLETRTPVYIGRNNAYSRVLIDAGFWNASEGFIRMAQYGRRGPDTESWLVLRRGGELRAAELALANDRAILRIEGGKAEIGRLLFGGEDGVAQIELAELSALQVDDIRFRPGAKRFSWESPNAALILRGAWTPQGLLETSASTTWEIAGRPLKPEDLMAFSSDGQTIFRPKATAFDEG